MERIKAVRTKIDKYIRKKPRVFLTTSSLIERSPILKGIITFPKFDGIQDWLVFVFIAHKYKGELSNCDEGHLEWIPNEKLLKL